MKSFCGARFILDEQTAFKPWADADSYLNGMTIKDIEFCTPIGISILSQAGGKYWAIKFFQGVKPNSYQSSATTHASTTPA